MINLHHGDCLEVLPTLAAGSVDMILADPPYTMTKTKNSCRPNYMPDGQILGDGPLPNVKDWMRECFRVLNNGHFYTFVNRNDLRTYLNEAHEAGFRLHNTISMIKNTKMPNRWYLKHTELILFFFKGKAKPINDMTCRDYNNVVMPNAKIHPTQKPISLFEKLVSNSTLPGQTVLDPFMGSGTTGVACVNTGRHFIGIESDERYFGLASDRIEDAQLEKDLSA